MSEVWSTLKGLIWFWALVGVGFDMYYVAPILGVMQSVLTGLFAAIGISHIIFG